MRTIACVAAIALACLLSTSEAATFTGPSEVDPSSPGKCVWKDEESNTRTLHPVGSTWTADCTEMSCEDHDGRLFISGRGCGVVGVEPPCTVGPVDLSKPYPECCPKPVCPTD